MLKSLSQVERLWRKGHFNPVFSIQGKCSISPSTSHHRHRNYRAVILHESPIPARQLLNHLVEYPLVCPPRICPNRSSRYLGTWRNLQQIVATHRQNPIITQITDGFPNV